MKFLAQVLLLCSAESLLRRISLFCTMAPATPGTMRLQAKRFRLPTTRAFTMTCPSATFNRWSSQTLPTTSPYAMAGPIPVN